MRGCDPARSKNAYRGEAKEGNILEDAQIVELYLSRNEIAIQHTSQKFGPRLRALSYDITRDAQTAEEFLKNGTGVETAGFTEKSTRHDAGCFFHQRLSKIFFFSESNSSCVKIPSSNNFFSSRS